MLERNVNIKKLTKNITLLTQFGNKLRKRIFRKINICHILN